MRKATLIFLVLVASVSVTDSVSDCVSLSELDGYVSRLDAQSAQQTAVSQGEAQHKISIRSDLVVLPVTVKDGNGNLVAGLQPRDFRVFDDGIEQIIDVFSLGSLATFDRSTHRR